MAVRLAVGIFAALALAAAMLGLGALLDETETGRSVAPQSRATIGAPFHLVDQNGHPFSSDALKGRVTLLFFGFTHCPDICPTSPRWRRCASPSSPPPSSCPRTTSAR